MYIIGGIVISLFLLFVLYEIGGISDPAFRKLVRSLRSNNLSKTDLEFDIGAWQRIAERRKAQMAEDEKKRGVLKSIVGLIMFIAALALLFLEKYYISFCLCLIGGGYILWHSIIGPYLGKRQNGGIARFLKEIRDDFRGFRNGKNK